MAVTTVRTLDEALAHLRTATQHVARARQCSPPFAERDADAQSDELRAARSCISDALAALNADARANANAGTKRTLPDADSNAYDANDD